MKYKLDRQEAAIEKNIAAYRPIKGVKRKKLENMLKKMSLKKPVTLRINDDDLKKIKEKAVEEGLPYQTLISSVLHKYAANRLYDRNEIFRNVK